MCLGQAEKTVVVSPQPNLGTPEELTDASEFADIKEQPCARWVVPQLDPCARKELLWEKGSAQGLGSEEQEGEFKSFLSELHEVFKIELEELVETNFLEMTTETGSAQPHKQSVHRMPYVVCQEDAQQLEVIQKSGVIHPSCSSCTSPVIIVSKRDRSYHFCAAYWKLNASTKADKFPLARVDDLLDQLGNSLYFSKLDLASGFWLIQIESDSQAKTAFLIPHGLFEFRVMPYGLTKAPPVFHCLMNKVLMDLNPPGGTDYVGVYIDDMIVFFLYTEGPPETPSLYASVD